MAIILTKGQRVDIGLSKITIGLGWSPNEGTGQSYDLDVSAFMLNNKRLIPKEEYFVFYGNHKSEDNSLEHTGDDRTGGNSDGGDALSS
jgi:tellurium resistance protein TerD